VETLILNGVVKNLRYVHHRINDIDGLRARGGATRCTVNMGTTEEPNIVEGIAICYAYDIFLKKMGRAVSKGRLIQELKSRDINIT